MPALIHQTEVSWDVTLDPASYFKVGQVCQFSFHYVAEVHSFAYFNLEYCHKHRTINWISLGLGQF